MVGNSASLPWQPHSLFICVFVYESHTHTHTSLVFLFAGVTNAYILLGRFVAVGGAVSLCNCKTEHLSVALFCLSDRT